jgi:hypothetical protein
VTTILVLRKERRIFADSLVVWGNRRVSTTHKVFRIRGGFVTGAGNQQAVLAVARYIDEGPCPDNFPDLTPDGRTDYTVLYLKKNGELYLYESELEPAPVLDDVYAIGTGDDIVRTALRLGKTPEEAMELACELDFNTGPPIVEMRL